MSEELKYKIGDRVWTVFDRGTPKYMTISKVGTKWVTLDCDRNWRFLIGSKILEEKDFGRVGTVFKTQGQAEEEATSRYARSSLINKFGLLSDSPLYHLPLEKLEAIDRILEGS